MQTDEDVGKVAQAVPVIIYILFKYQKSAFAMFDTAVVLYILLYHVGLFTNNSGDCSFQHPFANRHPLTDCVYN